MKTRFNKLIKRIIIPACVMIGITTCMAHADRIYADTLDDGIVTVATLEELNTALSDDDVTEVIVSTEIVLPAGTVLDGKNKTVRVLHTGMNAEGIVNSASTGDKVAPSVHSVFQIAAENGDVTIRNMTIRGGCRSAIVLSNGMLTMENVTVRDTYNTDSTYDKAGGGLRIDPSSSNNIAILKNCSIIRNAADYGGGILCNGEQLVMDHCSLSENRSLSTSGGGGAMEIKSEGTLYANNTVIANNTSTEIGGAINCYQSTLYLMNCTVTGNATTCSARAGGGLGNNGGNVYAVNSIFTNNYYINGSGVAEPSDIADCWKSATTEMHHCIYAETVNCTLANDHNRYNDDGNGIDYNDTVNTRLFPGYQNIGIIHADGSYGGVAYPHPVLLKRNGSLLYVPTAEDGAAANAGVKTYFSYNGCTVSMSYEQDGGNTALGGLPTSNQEVSTYIDGTARVAGVMGAARTIKENIYTVRLEKTKTVR